MCCRGQAANSVVQWSSANYADSLLKALNCSCNSRTRIGVQKRRIWRGEQSGPIGTKAARTAERLPARQRRHASRPLSRLSSTTPSGKPRASSSLPHVKRRATFAARFPDQQCPVGLTPWSGSVWLPHRKGGPRAALVRAAGRLPATPEPHPVAVLIHSTCFLIRPLRRRWSAGAITSEPRRSPQ